MTEMDSLLCWSLECKIKVPAGLVPLKASCLTCSIIFLCPHIAVPLCPELFLLDMSYWIT
jgi:hypothetical protein